MEKLSQLPNFDFSGEIKNAEKEAKLASKKRIDAIKQAYSGMKQSKINTAEVIYADSPKTQTLLLEDKRTTGKKITDWVKTLFSKNN